MKKYTKPELKVDSLEINDIITVSNDDANILKTWGSNLKKVDASDVVKPGE